MVYLLLFVQLVLTISSTWATIREFWLAIRLFLSHHTAEGLWTCRWRWRVFCSRLIAHYEFFESKLLAVGITRWFGINYLGKLDRKVSSFRSRMKLESFLWFATFRKTPTDLNPSERRQVACCGRCLKDAPSANFNHARHKMQRSKTDSLKRMRMQRTCKEMEIAAFGSFARIWEEAIRLVETCCFETSASEELPLQFLGCRRWFWSYGFRQWSSRCSCSSWQRSCCSY
jgi:hypothetical protein